MKVLRMSVFLFMFCAAFLVPRNAMAWDDCPLGLENDPAPGECSRYIDTDKNGICDHSEPAPEDRLVETTAASESAADTASTTSLYDSESLPELSGRDLKTKSVLEVAGFYDIDAALFQEELSNFLNVKVKQSDTFQLLHDNYGMEPSAVKELVLNVKNGTPKAEIAVDSGEASDSAKSEKTYYFGLISIILTLIYLVSFTLSKLKKISVASHRQTWNILLLITFLVSGLLGLLLTIRIQYGINFQLPFNMLFWHVEAGIAMTLISIFHILWHLPYYLNIFRKIKKIPTA